MFINPKLAIKNNAITGIKDAAKQVQPNAIDFTLDKLLVLQTTEQAVIGEQTKSFRPLTEVEIVTDVTGTKFWKLKGNTVYDGTSDMFIDVPMGAAAVLYTRSTFARNGIFIASGLYDSGYKGHIGFTIYTVGGPALVEVGVRIGQVALISADTSHLYAGGYNHAQGTHYTEQAPAGQRVIQSDPRRTETGMGPILSPDQSTFL